VLVAAEALELGENLGRERRARQLDVVGLRAGGSDTGHPGEMPQDLGANLLGTGVTEARLLLREDDYWACALGEAFEHGSERNAVHVVSDLKSDTG
jgi:hypothetical protein